MREKIAEMLKDIEVDLRRKRGVSEAYERKADQILSYQREEIEKGLLTEKECMTLSCADSPLSLDEWEKVSLWARGLVANAQLQKILALLK